MTFGDFRITNQRHCVLQMLLMIIFPFASSFPLSYWTHNSWPAFIASRNHQPFGTALYYAKKKTKESSNAAAIHSKIQGEIQSLNNNGTSLDVNNPTQVFQAVFEEQQQEAMACLLQLVVTNKIPFSMTSDQKKMAGFILDCIRMEEGRPKTIIKEPPQQDPTQCDNTNHWKIGIQAYFDGAAGPKKNPNVGGTGVVLECCAWSTTSAAEEIFREKILIQEFLDKKVNTPHQAEYSGVILALEEAMKMITLLQQKCNINQEDDYHLAFVCRGNSHLVIQQMKGKRQCRSANVKPFYTKAQKLLQKIMGATATTDITFEHIPHRYNLIADGKSVETPNQNTSFALSKFSLFPSRFGQGSDQDSTKLDRRRKRG